MTSNLRSALLDECGHIIPVDPPAVMTDHLDASSPIDGSPRLALVADGRLHTDYRMTVRVGELGAGRAEASWLATAAQAVLLATYACWSVAISTRTRKALWARSGNRCAICKRELALESVDGKATLVGDECHIVARHPGGPRGSDGAVSDLDGIDNLVLLCVVCHRLVDDQPEQYPVARLAEIKAAHEAEVAAPWPRGKDGETHAQLARAERESEARCADRWRALGVGAVLAGDLAREHMLGAPAEDLGGRSVIMLVGEVGVGKSLAGERLHQQAITAARAGDDAPFPIWLRARDIGGDLVEELAPVDRHNGFALTIDGLDEAGPARAAELLGAARRLANTRPGSRVVLTTRALVGIGDDDEQVRVSALTDDGARALITRVHEDAGRSWFRFAEPVREAARRPLFAIALAVLLGESPEWAPVSPAQIIDRLVRRALGHRWTASHTVLSELAIRSLERDGAAVRAGDVVPAHQLESLLETRLVIEDRGRLRFPLIIFAQWFAAHALLEGRVELDRILADVARLETWRYSFAVAVSTGARERTDEILDALVRKHPGFASIILDEAVAQLGDADAADIHDALDAGSRVRQAAAAWVHGLGPLAPMIAPFDGAEVPPLGVAFDDTRLLTTWWRGTSPATSVFEVPMPTSFDPPPDGWGSIRWAQPAAGIAWPWVWTRDQFARNLAVVVSERALPVGGSPLEAEAAWDVARRCVAVQGRRANVASLLASRLSTMEIDNTTIELAALQDMLRRHADANGELEDPWPWIEEDSPGFDRAICQRAEQVFRAALDGYAFYCDSLLATLASRLTVGSLLPGRAQGEVYGWLRGTDCPIEWWIEPVAHGQANTAKFDVDTGDRETLGEPLFGRLSASVARERPQAARWLSVPIRSEFRNLSGRAPAMNLICSWLWDDLAALGLVSGRPRDWSYFDLPNLSAAPTRTGTDSEPTTSALAAEVPPPQAADPPELVPPNGVDAERFTLTRSSGLLSCRLRNVGGACALIERATLSTVAGDVEGECSVEPPAPHPSIEPPAVAMHSVLSIDFRVDPAPVVQASTPLELRVRYTVSNGGRFEFRLTLLRTGSGIDGNPQWRGREPMTVSLGSSAATPSRAAASSGVDAGVGIAGILGPPTLAWARENQILLDSIVSELSESGSWPSATALSRKLARAGTPIAVRTVLNGLPRPFGFVNNLPDQIVLLLFGLRVATGAEVLLDAFMAALRTAVDRYRSDDDAADLRRDDIDLTDTRLRDVVSEILLREAPFLGSGAGGPTDPWSRPVDDGIVRYWNAHTIDEYLLIRGKELGYRT